MRVEKSVLAPALSLALAVGIFGVSFGVLAASAGLSLPQASAMSLLVFTGSAQYAAVAAAAAGAAMPAVVLTGLLLNTRCVAFGVALAPVIGARWSRRLLGAQFIIDESTALALAEEDPARARAAFWVTGLAVFGCWNAATVAGALAQSALGDPRRFGLDAVFPAAFVALLVPMVRRRAHLAAALAGAAVALCAVPFAPAGVPITLGALGALAGVAAERRVTWAAILALAVGTYALKAAGPALLGERRLPDPVTALLAPLPAALLAALVAVATFDGGERLVVDARVVGIAVAGVAVWRRLPFLTVVVLAAAAAAAARVAGMA